MNGVQLQQAFFAQLASSIAIWELFEHVPQVYLFVKDAAGRFVRINRALQKMHGAASEAEMLGKNDFDYHPPVLAAQYVAEDRQILATGAPLLDKVWLVPGARDGLPNWYISSKIPLQDTEGALIGIAGVMYPYGHTGATPSGYSRLTPAIEYVLTHYHERIEIPLLASQVHLSSSQFHREFRRLFGISPTRYIQQIRIGAARRQLERSGASVGDVALACGFYDQSHFCRQFKQVVGMSPRAYRKQFGGVF